MSDYARTGFLSWYGDQSGRMYPKGYDSLTHPSGQLAEGWGVAQLHGS
jgi:hypothetical protein